MLFLSWSSSEADGQIDWLAGRSSELNFDRLDGVAESHWNSEDWLSVGGDGIWSVLDVTDEVEVESQSSGLSGRSRLEFDSQNAGWHHVTKSWHTHNSLDRWLAVAARVVRGIEVVSNKIEDSVGLGEESSQGLWSLELGNSVVKSKSGSSAWARESDGGWAEVVGAEIHWLAVNSDDVDLWRELTSLNVVQPSWSVLE